MKHSKTKMISLIFSLTLTLMVVLTGCGQKETEDSAGGSTENTGRAESTEPSENTEPPESTAPSENAENDSRIVGGTAPEGDGSGETAGEAELEVCFGDDGDPFILHLYDNDTAAAIARHVGTASHAVL